jgi:large subunit ribosomal protein L41
LKPFVAENIDKPTKTHEFAGSVNGKMYLDSWKNQGGDI